jgi:hypothetical protein
LIENVSILSQISWNRRLISETSVSLALVLFGPLVLLELGKKKGGNPLFAEKGHSLAYHEKDRWGLMTSVCICNVVRYGE